MNTTAGTSPTCVPGCDGTASANVVSGGTAPYVFSILPAGPTQPTSGNFAGLCAGTIYTITATDNNSCTGTATISLSNPNAPTLALVTQNNVSCNGLCDGSAVISVSGGTPTYTMNIVAPASATCIPNVTTTAATNLSVGTYTITVTDQNSCSSVLTVNITEPTPVTATVTGSTNITCFGLCNGTVSVIGGGGTPAVPAPGYTFSIAPAGPLQPTNGNFTGLCATTVYTITATDGNTCMGTTTISLTEPTQVTAAVSNVVNPLCFGDCNGTATVTGAGGTPIVPAPGYTYAIAGPGTPLISVLGQASGLCNGTYTVTVCDANNCCTTVTIQMTQPSAVTATVTASGNASCFGTCDGTVSVTGGGGTPIVPAPDYTYSILPAGPIAGVNAGDFTGLCANTIYTITVTDANNCTGQTTVLITQPTLLSTSVLSSINPTCNPGCDGEITMTSLGGTPGYTYSSTPVLTVAGNVLSGLCAGIPYLITSTDANNCTAQTTITLNNNTLITATVTSSTNPTCNPGCNGTVTIGSSGGTAPYTITAPASLTVVGNVVSGLCSGTTYTITSTDFNGCLGTVSVTLTNSVVINTSVTSSTNPTCVPGCNGTVTMTSSGGTAGYTYSSPTLTVAGNVLSGLCSGTTYTITSTDANGCTGQTTVTLTNSVVVNTSVTSSTNPTCVPGCNGTVTMTSSGGTAGYTYSSPTLTVAGNVLSGLCSGVAYIITSTDANGCTGQTTVTLNALGGPTVSITSTTNITNLVTPNGQIVVISVGGTAPINYTISPVAGVQAPAGTFSSLPVGCYTITATDANGCTSTTSTCLTGPGAFSLTSVATNVNCFGDCNGTATITPNGGVGPNYTYVISPVAGTLVLPNTYTGLCAGTYTVTGTDGGSNTATTSFTVAEPSQIVINAPVLTQTGCNPNNIGTASVTANGGTGFTKTYTLNPAMGNAPNNTGNFINLTAQTYTVTVADANNCTVTSTFQISTLNGINLVSSSSTPISCNNGNNGSITIVTNGGTGTPTYSLNPSNAPNNQNGVFSGLTSATYTVTATDGAGCTVTTVVNLANPTAITVTSLTSTNPLCNGSANGTITVVANGGTGALNYSLLPANAPNNSTGLFAGLTAANYTVTITDANNCTVTSTINLVDPVGLAWNNATSTNITCFGANNGIINSPATGGTNPIIYTINPVVPGGPNYTNLGFGSYTVTATDANNCSITSVYNITEPTQITLSAPIVVNVLCFGSNTGSITTTAGGGTPAANGYNYTLNPGNVQNNTGVFGGLGQGTYNIVVSDANNCTTNISNIIVNQPPPISFSLVNVQDVQCYGDNTGTISVLASGGVGGFSYNITPVENQPTPGFFTNLYAGTYVVVASDANNCTISTVINVNQNPQLFLTSVVYTEPKCFGEANGAINATATGGVGAIVYSLNGGGFQPNGIFLNLAAGQYILTLRDALGCSTDTTLTLTQPLPVGGNITTTRLTCVDSKDGIIQVQGTGGRGDYKYALKPGLYINKSGLFRGLDAGTYTLTITDSSDCEFVTTVNVDLPINPLSNTFTKQDLACYGKGNEGLATANASGGTPPYLFLWNTAPVQTNATATGLYFGNYVVQITDINGCSIKDTVTINAGPCCDEAFLPNAFSPNNDGQNDEFKIFSTAGIEVQQLEILNRWGQVVYRSNDYRKGWNGVYNGEDQKVGTYHYVFRYKCLTDGQNYIKKGDVTLLR